MQVLPLPSRKDHKNKRLTLPDLPKEKWCDFRIDYETGMTLKEIGAKYICDPRTVKRNLQLNIGSTRIGYRHTPTILAPYLSLIDHYLKIHDDHSGICRASDQLTKQLRDAGYTGSERTVRNYLRANYYTLERKDTLC